MSKKFIISLIVLIFLLIVGGVFGRQQKEGDKEKKISTETSNNKKVEELSPEEIEKIIKEGTEAEEQLKILNAETVTEDVKIEGITIIKKEDKKVIKNEEQGYEMEVPLGLTMARTIKSEFISLYKPDEEGNICVDRQCSSEIDISVEENPEKLSLEEWLKKERAKNIIELEKVLLNTEKVYRYTRREEIYSPAGFVVPPEEDYFLIHGNKIYTITTYPDIYRKVIESFSFL